MTIDHLRRCAAALLMLAAATAHAGRETETLSLELVTDAIQKPMYVVSPPRDPARLLVVQQRIGTEGAIWLVKNGALQPAPFLTIQNVSVMYSGGVACVAFDPEYPTRPYVYVVWKAANGDVHVSRFTVDASGDAASPASELPILRIEHPNPVHNGGWLGFGPDGMLYVSSGDGGPQGDTDGNAQNTSRLLGKMLRLDVRTDDFPLDPNRNYAIPPDNPFVATGAREEIWAFGLREPWRASFDRGTGDFYIGDVGQDSAEEINFEPAGHPGGSNYGWRCLEGFLQHADGPECSGASFVDPVHAYERAQDDLNRCVVGGYVYRGREVSRLIGHYLYGDHWSGRIWSFRMVGGVSVDHREYQFVDAATGAAIDVSSDLSSFGEDACGELYVTTHVDPAVYRIVSGHGRVDCNANGIADRCEVAIGFTPDANGNGVPDDCDPQCAGDLDGDGRAGFGDLVRMLASLGPCGEGGCPKDLDGSGDVGLGDVTHLLLVWGPCP
jgi:glucose/arabinose dehydrogenase